MRALEKPSMQAWLLKDSTQQCGVTVRCERNPRRLRDVRRDDPDEYFYRLTIEVPHAV